MKLNKLKVESKISGKGFYTIDQFDSNVDFCHFENEYLKCDNPFYVSCKVPIKDLKAIQSLESYGFRFMENRLKLKIKLKRHNPIVDSLPYSIKIINSEELNQIKSIARSTFVNDRFSIDPALDANFSGKRYETFVDLSFNRKEENLLGLWNNQTNEVEAFGSNKILSNTEALILLGGVRPGLRESGIGAIHDFFVLNWLYSKGVKEVYTHISLRNKPILDLQVNKLGYSIIDSFLVLRKIYGKF